jgi:hypothetical protein
MTRRPTFSEIAWPDDPLNPNAAIEWARSITVQVLDWTWRAFDILHTSHLGAVDFTQPLEQMERDLVRHHFTQINVLFAKETDGYASFTPFHEWPEMETRSGPSAKPPANDIAFVSTDSNQRWAFAVEAKVLPTKGQLGEYMKDVNDKFVGGVASPLVGDGGMIGYLLCNEAPAIFMGIEKRLGQKLEASDDFPGRFHRVSFHERSTSPKLRIHHMLMTCVIASADG